MIYFLVDPDISRARNISSRSISLTIVLYKFFFSQFFRISCLFKNLEYTLGNLENSSKFPWKIQFDIRQFLVSPDCSGKIADFKGVMQACQMMIHSMFWYEITRKYLWQTGNYFRINSISFYIIFLFIF